MMSYDKSDIRFELSIFENLILVEKIKLPYFLGTSKAEDYPKQEGKRKRTSSIWHILNNLMNQL